MIWPWIVTKPTGRESRKDGVAWFPGPGWGSDGWGELECVAEVFELVDEVASSSVWVVVADDVVDA